MQDLAKCKSILVKDLRCEKDTLVDYYKNLSDSCDVILEDCSTSHIDSCLYEMCECFT
ncbi:unnamed protein product [Meloidogyne enterolobii]